MSRIIRFHKPFPKQADFLRSQVRYTAYGGSRGGGKSDVARNKAILLCVKWAGIQILFMRRTFPEINENHLLPCLRILNGVAQYKAVEKAFLFPNGSRLKFGYCNNEKRDLLQYQGQAYDVIFMEECTQFPEIVFTTMTESNRSSGLMRDYFPPRMYFTCNPGGVGHAWFKRLFIDCDYRNQERAEDYCFIQATVYDNPWLVQHSPDYVRALENLPDDRKRAMLHGDWNVFEGQYFPEFQRGVHTCVPFAIPAHWQRYRFFDYGFDMFACYWAAMSEDGIAYIYREVYEGGDKKDAHGNAGTGLTISQAAQAALAVTCEPIQATIAPPDMWNRRQDSGESAADLFAKAGMPLVKANNKRVMGWLALKEWLQVNENRKPRVIVFDNCTNLIHCMPLCQYSTRDTNDVATEPHEITHAPDALRYFISYQPMASSPLVCDYDTYDYDDEATGLIGFGG